MQHKPFCPLTKRANRGFRGFPAATISFYGRDDRRATKVAVGILPAEGAEPRDVQRWFSEGGDIRDDPQTIEAVRAFIDRCAVRRVMMPDRILGCPHEETIDYPLGEHCPNYPFWASRDRSTGERVQ